jgi:pentatricopeptide repeat protein
MTEVGIKKNVIIFGAAMSCMEKTHRADIALQLMDRMKIEGVAPNVHIYNSAISACARNGLWEKGLELFNEMEELGVARDVVSYNAVLDAVCSQVPLARRLFKEGTTRLFLPTYFLPFSSYTHSFLSAGVERGFYAKVSRLGTHWLELDLHFLSLGGGEVALGWWFEECLVPYLADSPKLAAVKSIDIVTGYGKSRSRGARQGDDGMRKRIRAMLRYMNIQETEQPNKGRIHIDKAALDAEVAKNGGKIIFDEAGYNQFKNVQTTANIVPHAVQKVRPRILPQRVYKARPRNDQDDNDRGRPWGNDGPRRRFDGPNLDHRGPDRHRDGPPRDFRRSYDHSIDLGYDNENHRHGDQANGHQGYRSEHSTDFNTRSRTDSSHRQYDHCGKNRNAAQGMPEDYGRTSRKRPYESTHRPIGRRENNVSSQQYKRPAR